ncbi:MAG: hypothetical protein ACYDG0_02850 [Vulcanimicrobiaceae bacterium]
MIAALDVRDGRILARLIHLAHRFGCVYTRAEALQRDGSFRVRIHIDGPSEALARLRMQIDKLAREDKENNP